MLGDDEHAASERAALIIFNFRFAPTPCITTVVREQLLECSIDL